MWFLYALIGAFGKSYSGFFRKRLAENITGVMFIWLSYSITLTVLTPYMFFRLDEVVDIFLSAPIVLIGASVSVMIATLMNLEALKREELSYIAPLNAFVPIFTLVIAAVTLGENPPMVGTLGILAIFAGAYVINLRPNRVRWYDPLRHLFTNIGALLSIGVALLYAINTVFLKEATNRGFDYFVIMYAFTIIGWLMLVHVPLFQRENIKQVLKQSKVNIAGAALSSFAGSFFHILAVGGSFASYAASIRRFDSVISVGLGWRYLSETNIKNKLIGALLMIIGAIIIALSG